MSDLRPVAVSTHQGYWEGLFHCFTEAVSGNTKTRGLHAMIEDSNGNVSMVDLSYHSLKFLDR